MIKSRFIQQRISRFSKYALLALIISLSAVGALLVYGHTNPPQSKFSVKDATTRENNGKRIRAKPGYELVKNGDGVSARRLSKPTEHSSDRWACQCSGAPASGNVATCVSSADTDVGGFTCDGNCGCTFQKWPPK